ncbi:Inorganic pyrophosphatase 2 [Glycine soja]|uniref:Inorganic pyrophosphatase 2 n=1 Tax=Glycine soja TaxID=3848 RepID=A0A445GN11_GLYSO|nr:Inorganic pyrophosphatase 2 [Glycine soja]RZB62628.1 Inorganic pyrophosphatase 2 [Glycine soja]
MAGNVVVFDFDSTIIECDSDNWVLDEFGLTEKFYQLLPNMPWNPLMDKMMNELHSQGKTIEDIVQVLNRTPMHPSIVPAIKASYSLGYIPFSFLFSLTLYYKYDMPNSIVGTKGMIIERIQNSVDAAGKKFIYLGDGSVDFCPSLKLKDRDYLMPRKNFPLCDLVSENSNLIKAEVHAWRDGEELYDVLLHFINKAIGEGNGSISSSTPIISVDCKLEFN